MRKFLYILVASYIIFVVAAVKVEAQTADDDITCGAQGQQCCNIPFENPSLAFQVKPEDGGDGRWGCISLLLTDVCASDAFFWSSEAVQDMVFDQEEGINLNELASARACEDGLYAQDRQGNPMTDITSPNCLCGTGKPIGQLTAQLCDAYIVPALRTNKVQDALQDPEYTGCVDCFAKGGFWSGAGCIYLFDWKKFVEQNVFGIAIGFAGVSAFGGMGYATFLLQTSRGIPDRIKAGQELFTSSITGLMLIIFAVFILRFIGVDILRIPGFG